MKEILQDLDRWREQREDLALATLVSVRRSAPRPAGARMLITREGKMAGSISGGCVEGDIVERALQVLDTGEPVLAEYGISDEQGFEVGLSCGGEIEVLIQPFEATEAWQAVRSRVEGQQPAVLMLGLRPQPLAGRQLAIIDGETVGSINADLDKRLVSEAASALRQGTPSTVSLPWQDTDAEVFLDTFALPPRLFIVGATQVAISLAPMAKRLGFHVTVVDARSVLATEERFPDVDDLMRAWPDEALSDPVLDARSAVVVLTHDPKFDLPVLEIALRSEAGYIGAMGSRKTHARRIDELKKRGFGEDDLARIHAPIGLDIGGSAPEELALAILAEVVASRHGRSLSAEAGS